MRLQLYGTWEEAYALGLRHEPQPSAGLLETYGLALRDIGAHKDAEVALTRALEDVDDRLRMPGHNVHSRAGLERRASRIKNALAEHRAGPSKSTDEPSVINPSQLIP